MAFIKPVKAKKLYQEIILQIQELLIDGKIQPGDRLPAERELAEQLSVSRTSLREALIALDMMGVIDIRPGDGTYIRQLKIKVAIPPLEWALTMDRNAVYELLESRKMLEVEAAVLAAERADEEELRKFDELMVSMMRDTEGLGDKDDLLFHKTIVQLTHNHVLIQMHEAISEIMEKWMKSIHASVHNDANRKKKVNDQHYEIYKAIRNKDRKLAKKLMYAHLVLAIEEIQKSQFEM